MEAHPYIAYKYHEFDGHKIVLINLQQNETIVVDLDQWEIMNFVRQSEIDMDETFDRRKRKCRLLFLAQRDGKTRLMQLIGDTTKKEINKRFRISLFSGCLEFTDIELTEEEAEQPSSLLESKQIIDPDKIQAISLLSY